MKKPKPNRVKKTDLLAAVDQLLNFVCGMSVVADPKTRDHMARVALREFKPLLNKAKGIKS